MDTVRSRNCWFFIISELESKFELNVGYKAADNTVSFVSAAKRSAQQKPPFGPPISCEYKKIKNSQGQVGDYFTFKIKSGVPLNMKANLMNNLFAGETGFSRKCTSYVAQNKQGLLADYISLLSCSKGFAHYREDIYHENGTRKDGTGVTEKILQEKNGTTTEFVEFKQLAEEAAIQITKSKSEVIDTIVAMNNSSGAKKRKNETDMTDPNPTKTNKSGARLRALRKEIDDNTGVEQAYIGSYVGRAEVPIENIEISPKICARVNPWKVEGIASAMRLRFDPAQIAITVAPASVKDFDPRKLESNTYIVISGNHTLAALKSLEEKGHLRNLVGMEEGKILCYIVNTQSPAVLCYGGLRSKDIGSKFIRTPQVQDLLFVFNVLKKQFDKEKEALEVIVRYAKLLLFGADDITALKKLCAWRDDVFTKLLTILERFEIFETTDAKYQGNQELLRRGLLMSLTKQMFTKLSKMTIEYFEENAGRVFDKEISLKTLIEGFGDYQKLEKVKKILCQLAKDKSFESLRDEYPGMFEDEHLKRFFGAEIDSKKMNEQGKWLNSYYSSIISGSYGEAPSDPVMFNPLPSFQWFLENKLEEFDVAVINIKGGNLDVVKEVCDKVLKIDRLQFALMIFEAEEFQSKALFIVRSLNLGSDFRVDQILFSSNTSDGKVRTFNENMVFGILVGRGIIYTPPLDMFNDDISNLKNVISKLCPPTSRVASVSQGGLPLLHVHSQDILSSPVSYFGEERFIKKFQSDLQKGQAIDNLGVNKKTCQVTPNTAVTNLQGNDSTLEKDKFQVDSSVTSQDSNYVSMETEEEVEYQEHVRRKLFGYKDEREDIEQNLDDNSNKVAESLSLLSSTCSHSDILYNK